MPRFIFFKGLYSTLDLYTDEMLRICRERGYDSFVLHTTQGEDASCMHISEEQEKEERKELLRFLKEPVTAAVLSVAFLGSPFTVYDLIGFLLIISTIIILATAKDKISSEVSA